MPWQFIHRRVRGPTDDRRPRISPQVLYTAVLFLFTFGFGVAAFNIYRMVERTLTSSEVVLRLRQDVAQETFQSEDFTRALQHFETKQRQPEPSDWSTLENAFQ